MDWPVGDEIRRLSTEELNRFLSIRIDKGDLDAGMLRENVKHDADPVAYYAHLICDYVRDLEAFHEGLERQGLGDSTFRGVVTSEFHEMARRAMRRSFPTYYKANKEMTFVMERSAYQASQGHMEFRDFDLDGSNLEETLLFLRGGLDDYQRKLQLYAANAQVAGGGGGNVEHLKRVQWADLERAVAVPQFGVAQEVLLGDEYRHLRNAFAHGSYIPNAAARRIQFEDRHPKKTSNWEREYSFADFAVLYNHFLAVYLGILAARGLEVLDTMEALRGEVVRRARIRNKPPSDD